MADRQEEGLDEVAGAGEFGPDPELVLAREMWASSSSVSSSSSDECPPRARSCSSALARPDSMPLAESQHLRLL